MSIPVKRAAAVAVALLLLAGAAAVSSTLAASAKRARHDDLLEAGEAMRTRVQDGVRAQLASVEGRAVAAASIPVLRAQIGVVDASTLKDGFATEPWWLPVRQDFPIYGVAGGEVPDLLVGAEPGDLDFAGLVKIARARRQASAVLAQPGAAVAAAAAVIDRAGNGAQAVLVLGKPLDAAFADDLASRAKGAVLVSNGKEVILSSGPKEDVQRLKSALGQEAEGFHEDAAWGASATQLGAGTWAWTFVQARQGAGGPGALPWIVAGLGALAALFFGFRKPAAAPVSAEPSTITDGQAAPVRSNPGMPVRSNPGMPVRSDPGVSGRSGTSATANLVGRSNPGRSDPAAHTTGDGKPGKPLDRLGEGGMAEVFTAVAFGAESFRRAFVVKLLHSGGNRSEALVQMFIDEAKLASNLVHSNIIPVYDFGKMGDEYFMAQEYVLGRDLRRFVTRCLKVDNKPPAPHLCVFIAREALRALEYAHTRTTDDGRPIGLVHRDVSPNNILISARGEVKLFDFGIAKADEGRVHQTQTGVVKGNVQYMAPEQARGEDVDARADVAALGLVLYFLLAGRSLYKGDSAYTLLIQAAQGLTPELQPKLDALPKDVSAAVRLAIEPDREQRFQSAQAFENALSGMETGSAGELAKEMQRLFGDELKAEQAKFANFQPPRDDPPDGAEGGQDGSGEGGGSQAGEGGEVPPGSDTEVN